MSPINGIIFLCQTSEGDSFVFCLSNVNIYSVIVAQKQIEKFLNDDDAD